MRTFLRHVIAGVALVLTLAAPAGRAQTDGRTVTLQWRPVEQAVRYELELSKSPEMDPLLMTKAYPATQVKLRLEPGTYYFRVRGVDEKDAPGPWTDVQGFVVNPSAPRPASPKDGEVFRKELSDGQIELEWDAGVRGTLHQIEIVDAQGATAVFKTPRSNLNWKVPGPGAYRWRVGYETASGVEWSPFRGFAVEASAFPPPPVRKVVEYVDKVEYVEKEGPAKSSPADLEPVLRHPLAPRPEEWSAIVRGAQSVVAYSMEDLDSGISASGAAIVSLLSAELRWRGPKAKRQLWTFSGALNFELIRQTVLGTTFNLPRGYARLFYGREFGDWRLGGFAHFTAGMAGIFIVEGKTEATRTKVFRQGYGLGVMATYRASPKLFLSSIAMARLDTGGTSADLPNPLVSSPGFEAGFGVALGLSRTFFVEGRLRALIEEYSWDAAASGSDLSSLSNSFIILDAGLGFRL